MNYIDQREPGSRFEREFPNWANGFKKDLIFSSEVVKTEYNFKNIKPFPESKKDVLFPYLKGLSFSHKMDALKYCNDNQISFLWWNDSMFDLEGNSIDIGYYDLP